MLASNLKLISFLSTNVILLILIGCTTVPQRNPVPIDLIDQTSIPEIPGARFWDNEWHIIAQKRLSAYSEADFGELFPKVYDKPHNYLAVSGGGSNGAFGAGLLYGWSESGTRPEFDMVTGISTGALTAPFAFLGSDYDEVLKTIYTTISTKDIYKERGLFRGVFSHSVADTAPLQQLLATYITGEVVDKIAHEDKKGRKLLIGTFNLDAGRSVIWDIGRIASSDYPQKVALIHDVLRASAAIPVAFPPVLIPVEFEGKSYDELHVDGGTGSQVFVYPVAIDWKLIKQKLKVQGKPNVYVIRNSFINSDYQNVALEIVPIASRAIDSLIRTQGLGDLYKIYAICERDGNEFNLAYIPSNFTEESTEDFDPVYMSKLFDLGSRLGREGYPWEKEPPDYSLEVR